jgi:UTP--glucose-1-phosphate uridylyltransferase
VAEATRIRKAVIPAAGKGTRLLPLTKVAPKEMLPLGRKPVLEYVIEEIVSTGITEVLFVISHDKMAIPDYFQDYPRLTTQWTYQEEQKGLADAISCGQDFVGNDPFLVALGDSIITPAGPPHATSRVLDCFQKTDAEAVVIVMKAPREEISRYGIVRPKAWGDGCFEIDMLVEKPRPEDAPSDYAIAGRYAFNPSIFDYIKKTPPGAGGEMQITDSIGLLLSDSKPVWCVPLVGDEVRRDIGTFDTYFEAFRLAADSGW